MFSKFNTENYCRDEKEQAISDGEPETILKQTNKKKEITLVFR